MQDFSPEEQKIFEAIVSARTVQNFIWGEHGFYMDSFWDHGNWIEVFQKRVDRIAELDLNYPSWKIELRKRLLQQAALSIQALQLIDKISD